MAGHQAAGDAGGSLQHTPNPADTTPTWTRDAQLAALEQLREPFPDSEISQRPRIWCRSCELSRIGVCAQHEKTTCAGCGRYVTTAHHDLDYVGHADATARLLTVDPLWRWDPLALTEEGLPLFDAAGGLWIRLTVCGMSRLGYGDADGRTGTNAVKEAIGDAVRNAGMRYGMALGLWSRQPPPAAEPSEAQKVLERLRDPNVWGSTRALQVMRQRASDAGALEYVVEASGWRALGEVIDDRVSELERNAAQLQDRERLAAPAAVVHAEAAVRPPGQARRQPPVPSPELRGVELKAFAARVDNGWHQLGATEMALKEAEFKGLLGARIPGPDGQLYPVGVLLRGRINQLKDRNEHRVEEWEGA